MKFSLLLESLYFKLMCLIISNTYCQFTLKSQTLHSFSRKCLPDSQTWLIWIGWIIYLSVVGFKYKTGRKWLVESTKTLPQVLFFETALIWFAAAASPLHCPFHHIAVQRWILRGSNFEPYLIAHINWWLKFCGTPKYIFLPIWQQIYDNKYNFDLFILHSYCCVGCCHFLI